MNQSEPLWEFAVQIERPGERDGLAFSIVTSEDFIKLEKRLIKSIYSDHSAQKKARQAAMKADASIRKTDLLLCIDFRNKRLSQINCPSSNGCWLAREKDDYRNKGPKYSTHNMDHRYQKRIIVAVWSWWADSVAQGRLI